jgi:hypothetical protein
MDRFIDMLDAWVDDGVAPPPSRTDDPRESGKAQPALAMPEIACPLGVYYPSPNSTAGATKFAPFTGQGLEPLDEAKVFVDMNRNGVWDERETPERAWRRLGLLAANEPFTKERYAACVEKAARSLVADGFLSEANAAAYVQQAKQTNVSTQ